MVGGVVDLVFGNCVICSVAVEGGVACGRLVLDEVFGLVGVGISDEMLVFADG